MNVIVCIDERKGMLFHERRLSRDCAVIADIQKESAGTILWLNVYSGKLFPEEVQNIRVDEAFLEKAGPGEFCFVENCSVEPYAEKIEQIYIYNWNRKYPADFHLDLDFRRWRKTSEVSFEGNSHEKITKEIYKRDL